MSVEETPQALRLFRDNRTYYFCSGECLRSFADPDAARRSVGRRLAVAWPLSVLTVVLVLARPFSGATVAAAIPAAVVQFYAGRGFYAGAVDAVRRRIGNMDLLIATGTTAAFAYSLADLALPGRLPSATYFDASSLIVTVILTGTYLEQLTRRRAGSALRALAALLPPTVTFVGAEGPRRVRREELAPGMLVLVAPHERIPVDGEVEGGVSSVDEAILTGESRPSVKSAGAKVLAGARNLEGPLTVRATAVGPDAFVAQVGDLLQDAELARVPLQRQADRIASWFAPFTLGLAAAAAVLWLLLLPGDVTVGVLVFVTVAVTACPCAFGLATPAALMVGTGRAADEGILFRGGEAIERAATVDTVLFDKTGTLTTDEPEVAAVLAVPPWTEPQLIATAAALERGVDHPFASAIGREASRRGLSLPTLERVALEPGRGVSGWRGGARVEVVRGDQGPAGGSDRGPLGEWARAADARGESWALVVEDGAIVGALSFRSAVRPGAELAVAQLQRRGVRVAMVTGDSAAAARTVAAAVGIEEVFAGVDPGGKVAVVRRLRDAGRRTAFVGDGVNDAPALAAADVGIAIGSGTDVARETGSILLVRPELGGVPRALDLARRTVGRVRRNFAWALGYNAVLLPIAAGALVPFLGVRVYAYLPVLGAVAMGLSSTTVVLNSLSLRWSPGGLPPGRPTRARTARA